MMPAICQLEAPTKMLMNKKDKSQENKYNKQTNERRISGKLMAFQRKKRIFLVKILRANHHKKKIKKEVLSFSLS